MASTLQLPKERDLLFTSQVDQSSISLLTKSIIEINANDKQLKKEYKMHGLAYKPKPIKIHIDSYGGQVYQCFGLLGVIENSKTPIHTIITGCAMSCGFMIAICGHKRFAYKRSTLLYHQVSSGAFGKIKEIEERIVETKRLQEEIEKIVIEKTSISPERLKQSYESKEDWFITSQEALELNAIDKIIEI